MADVKSLKNTDQARLRYWLTPQTVRESIAGFIGLCNEAIMRHAQSRTIPTESDRIY